MKKIKILMVYNERGRSQTLSQNFNLFGIEAQMVHSLQEGLDLESEFDLLMVDVYFPLGGNESILAENESVEQFLGVYLPVFNFLQKTTKPVLLCDTCRDTDIQTKLQQLNILSKVVYVRAPLLMENGYLSLVFSLLGEDSDKVLYTVYLIGFKDELNNRQQKLYLTPSLLPAYTMGRRNAVASVNRNRPIEEILCELRNNK